MAGRRFAAAVTSLALAAVASLGPARAGWPERPITMVMPFAAGAPTDAVARIIGERMAILLGKPVLIENVPGAGGTLGTTRVAHALSDGYQLIIGNVGTHGAAPSQYPNLKYDPITDFTPIGLMAGMPMLVVTRNSFPARDMQEFVAELRAKGDRITEAHAGVGSQSHAFCTLLHAVAGTRATHVAYRGMGPAVNDLIAGHVDFACASLPNVISHLQTGQIRAIAVASPQRVEIIDQVPTAVESGFPGFAGTAWNGLFAPKGLAPETQARLSDALRATLAESDVRRRLIEIGCDVPDVVSPESLHRLVQTEVLRWGRVLQPIEAPTR